MPEQPKRHEFKAVIEGIDLSTDTMDRINRAVQKAVLSELANIDLLGSMALDIPSDGPDNGNNGIELRRVDTPL